MHYHVAVIWDNNELQQRLAETLAEFQQIMMNDAIVAKNSPTGRASPLACRLKMTVTNTVTKGEIQS